MHTEYYRKIHYLTHEYTLSRFSTPSRQVAKRVPNYSVCMKMQCSGFRKMAVLKKNMNCKLKLHSKGFY